MRIALTLLVLCFIPGIQSVEGAEQPNIIVIMADDLGYGDVGCNGATQLQTPHIDRLAARGLRFTQGYCSASTCTPVSYTHLTLPTICSV